MTQTERKQDDNIQQAVLILRGEDATARELYALAMKLKAQQQFGFARKLLAKTKYVSVEGLTDRERVKTKQQHALCTYKDPDLPEDVRYERALGILAECADLAATRDQETLGIAGAIFKRKWFSFGQRGDLERALGYYWRGYQVGVEKDWGYTAINAAYVLDLLAYQEKTSESELTNSAQEKRDRARKIREEIIDRLPARAEAEASDVVHQWWYLVTVAEAMLGVGRYNDAGEWLVRARELPNVPEWEFESTAKQIASLAATNLRFAGQEPDAFHKTPEWQVLARFLEGRAPGLLSAFHGKVGLALSGGGFRASLFHIGVLARLAELDMLRHVEILSCVSGGSILGAHYYLEVRNLLQTKKDQDITRDDYIEVVGRVATTFLAGVQRNIRTRVIGHLPTNIKMMVLKSFSRTERVGELYERELYSRVKDGGGHKPRYMDELLIFPLGEGPDFRPKYHNWRRSAKVPILVLNAASLNTGHNWQFTASWMGEPPYSVNAEIDGNYRLRRMYYGEAPETFRKVRLGHAVAASACVPGLFEPLIFSNMYQYEETRKVSPKLVDGGVFDNQGTSALLEQDCTVLLVSDASGQMGTVDNPSEGILGVPVRSSSIIQTRVRQAEYDELSARRKSHLLRGLMFVHLKKDLDVDPIDWVECEDPVDASDEARPASRRGELTSYGVRKDIQQALAAIRTDLDSFSELEAYALMVSGYRMTVHEFKQTIHGFHPDAKVESHNWPFMDLEPAMQSIRTKTGARTGYDYLFRVLQVGASAAFKVWKLVPALTYLGWTLLGLGLIAVLYALYTWRDVPVITYGSLAWLLIGSVVAGGVARWLLSLRSAESRVAIGLSLALVGWLVALFHIGVFDRIFLKLGRLSRMKT